MINNAAKVNLAPGDSQTRTENHPLADMPPFNSEAAVIKNTENTWENPSDEFDAYDFPGSASSLEKSAARIPKYEDMLSNIDNLRLVVKDYLLQYQPNSESRADTLSNKDKLDHYVSGQLSGNNANEFINSEQFKNYSSYIISVAQQKAIVLDGKTHYPELTTNPVLSNPNYLKQVLSVQVPAERVDMVMEGFIKSSDRYKETLKDIEGRLANYEQVSQNELNMVGDYLYSGRDFGSTLASGFARYMFSNDAKQRQDLKPSTQIGGALANYFVYKNTLDDRLKERRIIIANNAGLDNNNKLVPVKIGVSSQDYSVLEQNRVNNLSLSSGEGLNKSRTADIADLYSLMMVTYHELTHDYQKLMVADGKTTSGAMAYILNMVLRANQSTCFPLVDKNLSAVLDEKGNQVKTGYYNANHDSDEIEIQADEEAWQQCRKFIHEHEVYKPHQDENAFRRYMKCKDNVEEVRFRRTFAMKVDENGKEVHYIRYDIDQLRKRIGESPNIIKRFPQLAEFFDNNGKIKPEIFFNRSIVDSNTKGFDTIADDFGAEIATYALSTASSADDILNFVRNSGDRLNRAQINNCLTNFWNTLRQNAIKTRPLKRINYDNYADTRTRGKNVGVDELKVAYLKQYLYQLYCCTYIADTMKKQYPQSGEDVDQNERVYFVSYYDELSNGVTLDPEFSKNIKKRYLETDNPELRRIAAVL